MDICEQVVFASEEIRSSKNESFSPLEWGSIILIIDLESVLAFFKTIWYLSPKLSEVRQTSRTHPDNKMLY